MHTFDKFIYLFSCFATCSTKVTRPYKWLFGGCNLLLKLIIEDGIWQTSKKQILTHRTITQVEYMRGDSYFWSGWMKVKKKDFCALENSIMEMALKEASRKMFGLNLYFQRSICGLYNVVNKKSVMVATVFRSITTILKSAYGLASHVE